MFGIGIVAAPPSWGRLWFVTYTLDASPTPLTTFPSVVLPDPLPLAPPGTTASAPLNS